MADLKDVGLTLSTVTPKSQLTAEQSLTNKHWNLPKKKKKKKKVPKNKIQRRSHSEMVGGVKLIRSNSIPAGSLTHGLESNCITEALPQE